MTQSEKEMLDMHFKELTKHEVAYLEERGAKRNIMGAYLYSNDDLTHTISLELFLCHYKKYLIDNNIVKEVD